MPRLTERTCQCAGCGRYFSSTGTFDKHRAWAGEQRICRAPNAVGLVQRPTGVWGGPPMSEQDKEKLGWTRR